MSLDYASYRCLKLPSSTASCNTGCRTHDERNALKHNNMVRIAPRPLGADVARHPREHGWGIGCASRRGRVPPDRPSAVAREHLPVALEQVPREDEPRIQSDVVAPRQVPVQGEPGLIVLLLALARRRECVPGA